MTRLIRTSTHPITLWLDKAATLVEQKSLVVVDPQPDDYQHLLPILEEHGAGLHVFQSGAELLYHGLPDSMVCGLVNLDLPDMSGYELCETIRQRHREKPIFLVANEYDSLLESEVLSSGIGQFACKPIHARWLSECVFWQLRPPRSQRKRKADLAIVSRPNPGSPPTHRGQS